MENFCSSSNINQKDCDRSPGKYESKKTVILELNENSTVRVVLRAAPLEDLDWNGPLALGISVWIFQGKHSSLIGFLHSEKR